MIEKLGTTMGVEAASTTNTEKGRADKRKTNMQAV